MSIWDPKQTLDSVGLGRQEQKRSTRVADAIRNELAVFMLQKVRDPKLAEVSISRVEVTDDLRVARIFFTLLAGNKRAKATENSLHKAKGFMRTHLAKTLNMRYTPDLQFRYDETADKVAHVESIFQEIENERKERGEDS
ncbi:30S ribosome-binding factor RbfA [Desulfosediminicola flagellatus]|uniref:30S ribosome-binding factor RbfA n=1 Tax=Desulfosediminicola flagellatus TaxID=2569541 RepID=UPI0010AC8FB1|nr:30S ribosome-binding factor RbfA [Desulfosediminicola flagellatus]